MDVIGSTETKIQNLFPGAYALCGDQYLKVSEYPLVTGQGVFVNFIGGQIGPLPLDTMVETLVWE